MADGALDIVEKFEKLVTWQDEEASMKVLFLLFIAFLVVSFIPLRGIIIVWLFGKFSKGSTYYHRRYTGNSECCRIELRNFFYENKTYEFETLFGDSTDWTLMCWPSKLNQMELRIHMQQTLKILIPDDFTKVFETPNDLIKEIGYIDNAITLKSSAVNEWDIKNNKLLYRKSTNPIKFFLNFLSHNICSNVYQYQNMQYHLGKN
mmetsp:Transcript_31473/g.42670  ORF Transcript_31473/g.42670 Transcript_31473/m.42670 type:complete len:205 (-) Transcript_31473:76-690(-)